MKPSSASTMRTTLNVRADLLREAEAELGTNSHTTAVNAALEEYVANRRLRRLLEMELPDLTLESVEEMRRTRPAVD